MTAPARVRPAPPPPPPKRPTPKACGRERSYPADLAPPHTRGHRRLPLRLEEVGEERPLRRRHLATRRQDRDEEPGEPTGRAPRDEPPPQLDRVGWGALARSFPVTLASTITTGAPPNRFLSPHPPPLTGTRSDTPDSADSQPALPHRRASSRACGQPIGPSATYPPRLPTIPLTRATGHRECRVAPVRRRPAAGGARPRRVAVTCSGDPRSGEGGRRRDESTALRVSGRR